MAYGNFIFGMSDSYNSPPTLVEQMHGKPSAELYLKISKEIKKRYENKLDIPPYYDNQHYHYIQFLRECQEHSECMQILYVGCTLICHDHKPMEVSKKRLSKYLEDYLQI